MRFLLISILIAISSLLEARLPDLIPYRKGDKWGYCDSTKKIIIDTIYERAEFFEFGRAVVMKKRKFGVIDQSGKQVVACQYKSLSAGLVSGYWKARLIGDKFGVIDSTGKFVISPLYDEIFWCGGNYIAGKMGFDLILMDLRENKIDTLWSGLREIPPQWIPKCNAFIVYSNASAGVVNLKGDTVIPFVYSELTLNSCGYFAGTIKGKTTYYNSKFARKKKLPKRCRRNESQLLSNRLVPAHSDQTSDTIWHRNWGWKNGNGSWVTMPKYDQTSHFMYGLATFLYDNKYGMVDTSFNEIVPAKYEVLYVVRPGFAMVTRRPRVDLHKDADLRLFLGYVDIHGTEYWED